MKGHKVTDPSKPVSAQIRVNAENSFFLFLPKMAQKCGYDDHLEPKAQY